MTDLTPQGRFAEIAREDARAALVTVLEGPQAGAKLLVEPDGTRRGSLGSPELDDEGAAGDVGFAVDTDESEGEALSPS